MDTTMKNKLKSCDALPVLLLARQAVVVNTWYKPLPSDSWHVLDVIISLMSIFQIYSLRDFSVHPQITIGFRSCSWTIIVIKYLCSLNFSAVPRKSLRCPRHFPDFVTALVSLHFTNGSKPFRVRSSQNSHILFIELSYWYYPPIEVQVFLSGLLT
jgi:hypothetical protein